MTGNGEWQTMSNDIQWVLTDNGKSEVVDNDIQWWMADNDEWHAVVNNPFVNDNLSWMIDNGEWQTMVPSGVLITSMLFSWYSGSMAIVLYIFTGLWYWF